MDKMTFKDENEILFADIGASQGRRDDKWKIIIADDEEQVHAMTRMVMKKFHFEDRGIELISAYSGKETIDIMRNESDIAIILLDVVMEHENSGLEVVRTIREELNNPFVRIILRTGQPGQAPEEEVIRNYDINDYKSKTELTVKKLYTSVIASLRAYKDMKIIESNRVGLEKIINSTRTLFEFQSLEKFTGNVLDKLVRILTTSKDEADGIYGLAFTESQGDNILVASLNENKEFNGLRMEDFASDDILERIKVAARHKRTVMEQEHVVCYFETSNHIENFIYLSGFKSMDSIDSELIKIFLSNVSVAYENIYLNNEIIDTQKEVIFTLGEIVENRSKETASHTRRVAEYSYILAKACGESDEKANVLRLASPMHDIGKIGIPDYILNKPGKLTTDEFEVIKNHTVIGYEVLKQSSREIMKTAATIALQHHERWNGKGYPYGLKGEEIDLFSRITTVADVYDALGHKRVYKDAWEKEVIYDYMREERGQMFDPKIVDLFFDHLEDIKAIERKYPD